MHLFLGGRGMNDFGGLWWMNSGETQPYHAFLERAVARIGYGPTGTRTSTSKIRAGSSGKGTGSVVPSGAYLND